MIMVKNEDIVKLLKLKLTWDSTTFHLIRYNALSTLSKMITNQQGMDEMVLSEVQNKVSKIIIVDDIMYLRSMRRQIYCIARDHTCKLLTIFIDTVPNIARSRNSRRTEKDRVDDEAMEKIISRFERPNHEFICDRNHLVISLDDFAA
jgi:tRNA uridine 5-carbamoylmethylation protein Kti12